ncbi:2-oxoglutarate dehydrogenase E1 component [Desulfococcaceae bacterium HSG8]|nr:2-oxoglutarate dehydrogenase E1 component [Desulfococcaceae bacterium HSG8]
MELTETLNAAYIDAQYQSWKADPNAVSRDWQFFFEGFELADTREPDDAALTCTEDQALRQSRVEALKYRYRDVGHLLACLDPLTSCPVSHPLLELSALGLTPDDLDAEFYTRRFSQTRQTRLRDIIQVLRETYCRSIGVEYMHLQDPEERRWLQDRMESVRNQPVYDRETKVRILNKLCQAALFEQFLHKKYMAQTRFSLEGADALIPMLDAIFLHVSELECQEIILGMAHRGRLNVQTNILYKPYEDIFREFINSYDPGSLIGSGDVKYHNGYLADIHLANERTLKVLLMSNPSHLESVDPVIEGIAKARQDMLESGKPNQILPLVIHGDAAFAGQGVVPETLNMSQLDGYSTGGTVHIIINNQIGYTTLPENARSTRYSTDVAKMLMIPIFHVHGENPEAVVHAAKLAADYRMVFGKDVVIDLICYRRYGHNEGDEPYFTQPQMYQRIRERPPLYQIYSQKLTEENLIGKTETDDIGKGINQCLEEAFNAAQENPGVLPRPRFYENWQGFHGNFSHEPSETGVEEEKLISLARSINEVPQGFSLHPKLDRLLKKRLEAVESGEGIDWACAEALAFASILSQGDPIRLSGQDSGRGTFSHRHAVPADFKTGEIYIPLNRLGGDHGRFSVLNSPLSEVGVLGFEYGYSVTQPRGLVIWEAQFGDFANNAQSVIDLFITSGESKWQRLSGLVMLLPHGLEGLGPEHSSARLERFLGLCAENNIQVCNLTTPVQYFHLLRRQAISSFRKPLIIMAPKSLLRHPLAISEFSGMTSGHFHEILDDPASPEAPRRVIFCSGKIYYDLFQRREELKAYDIAIIRLEQFYPFPRAQLEKVVEKYRNTDQWCWMQEEPANMGASAFIRERLEILIGNPVAYIGRKTAVSPATGFANLYRQEQAEIVEQAVG